MIAEIFVGGVHADFGSISARNLVTDANGEARLIYTAPALPSGPQVDTGTIVEIAVTPLDRNGTGGFGNSIDAVRLDSTDSSRNRRAADGLQPAFTFAPSSPTDHQNVRIRCLDEHGAAEQSDRFVLVELR